MASKSNGQVAKEIVEAIETASDAVDENEEFITVTNSDPAKPEKPVIKENSPEESYEYSQTTDY